MQTNLKVRMYANPAYGTPFSVKDILSWTAEQQAAAHYGMDYQNMNMNYGNYQYDTQRLGDSMSPMMNAIGNMGSNSCLYSTNSPSSSLQPTYTNLSCSPSVSSMAAMSSMHVPVKTETMSPKQSPYEDNSAATPGSDTGDIQQSGPPGIDPGPDVHGLPAADKVYGEHEECIDKRKCSILFQVCMLISDDSLDSPAH